MKVVKGIFDYAVSNGWIGENPCGQGHRAAASRQSDDDMVFLYRSREVELLGRTMAETGGTAGGRAARPLAGLHRMPA